MGDPVPPPAFKCWIPALVIAAVLLLVLLLYVMLCVIWPFCIVWPLQSGALQPATSTSYGSSPPATLPAHAILSPPSSQHPPPTSPGTTSPGTTPSTTKPGTTTPVIGPGTIAPTDHCTEGSVWDAGLIAGVGRVSGREVMILEDRTSAPRHKTSQNLPKPPQTSTPRWPPL